MTEPEKLMYQYFWWMNNVGAWYSYGMRYSYNDMMSMGAAGAERIARRHNGGPNGDNVDATKGYWAKVKSKLQQFYPGVIPGI